MLESKKRKQSRKRRTSRTELAMLILAIIQLLIAVLDLVFK